MFVSTGINYTVYIQPEDRVEALAAIIAVIDGTEQEFTAEAFNFSHPDIEKALENAKGRGVVVDIVEDAIQAASKTEITQNTALSAVIGQDHISQTESEMHHYMHLKTGQSDRKIVIEGSNNWSVPGFLEDQTLLIIEDPQFAQVLAEKHARLKALAEARKHLSAASAPGEEDFEVA